VCPSFRHLLDATESLFSLRKGLSTSVEPECGDTPYDLDESRVVTLVLESRETIHSGNTETSAETRNGISRNSGKDPKTMETGQGLQPIESALFLSHRGRGQRALVHGSKDL
jgi:hypothetical protein